LLSDQTNYKKLFLITPIVVSIVAHDFSKIKHSEGKKQTLRKEKRKKPEPIGIRIITTDNSKHKFRDRKTDKNRVNLLYSYLWSVAHNLLVHK